MLRSVAVLLALAGAWITPAPGVSSLAIDEDGIVGTAVRFDLQRYRAEVVVLGPDRPETVASLRRRLGAAAAINGGFFDAGRQSLGLRIAGARTVVPFRPRVDWGVLVLRPGRAAIVHSRDFKPDPGIEGAIQVGPRLVAAGRPLRLKPQIARRSAVALDGRDAR
jgi:hypothetical protein